MKRTMMSMAVAMGLAAGAAHAQSTEGWSFEVTPFVWYAGLEGDLKVAGRSVDFEKDAADLLDAAEVGGSIRFGATYDRFVIGALVDYFSLSTDELEEEDQPRGGTVDAKMLLAEALVGYRVDGWAEGQSFVFGVGVRNLSLDTDLKSNAGGTFSDDRNITDVMFYVLPSVPMFSSSIDGLRFNPVLGIGAGDSDLAYELFPQVQYDVNDALSVRFGYRRVGWRFEGDGDNEFNADLAGLILGVGYTY
ncbi:MAG TPA: hypothetical protein PKE12_14840 [Kiritimatiellia bacterium]|nr:hypothetical protein [Kiritimatiellia bacterium]